MPLLDDKVFLLTGAAGGLGRAQALALARAGASLVVNDLGTDVEGRGASHAPIDALGEELIAAGCAVVTDASDAAAPGAADRLLALALERFGRLDGAVCNAGIRRERSVLKCRDEDLAELFRVNVAAPFALLRAVAAHLVDRRAGGSIVLTTGPTAFFGVARQAAAGATEAAVVAMVRSAAVELRRHGVRVNAVAPTARTRQTEHLPLFQGIARDSMSPEHVAPLVEFLLSDEAAEVHGEVLGVAGGRVYALQARETSGAFAEGGALSASEVLGVWSDITRG